jgi:SagB-type dehydrogenase family enzyme
VRRACDRVDVDIVLASGVVVADGGFDRPAPMRRRPAVAPGLTWVLAPGARSHLNGGHLTVSFEVLPDEVFQENGRILVARTRRTVDVEFDASTLLCLLDRLSSGRTSADLARDLPLPVHDAVHDVVADLVGWGAVVAVADARPRLAHAWSMRGAERRGRLSPAEVADLTFSPRTYSDDAATVVPLADVRPFPVDSLATVLRRRRSPTSYNSSPISVDQLGQLLGGACGVTGELVLADRAIPLRAYPSPGALYAVDVYLVPTRVEGLAEGVFRYDTARHALVAVHDRPVDPASFCLPDVRAVVNGVAVFIALTICLPRATPKYGDESYRILVAEAGCIAENLILVAHALGLRAGPFTGVFDSLVDQAIGLDAHEANFVVGVLVGREGNSP